MRSNHRADQIESTINVSALGDGMIDAAAACALLDVKRPSLYAYVSRGLVRSVRVGNSRARLYVADDVRRLAARSAARRGHGAVAAGALRWGEPVLESAITSIDGGVLAYRGRPIGALIDAGLAFEDVAELLWQASPVWPWPAPPRPPAGARIEHPVWRMIAALPAIALADRARWRTARELEHQRARAIVVGLAAAAGARFASGRRIAAAIAAGTRIGAAAEPVLETALIASADHELNASAFAARVAASAGAELHAAVGAALYAFTGPRHGGASDRIDGFLDDLPARGLRAALAARLARGDGLPGFGHPLYPAGDPRTPIILARLPAPRSRAAARRAERARAVAELGHELTGLHPTLDYALLAMVRTLDLPPPWASTLFAIGRSAGWIAHAFEQRDTGAVLRPRARYTGPTVG